MISMFFSATAQQVGWPEFVYACIQRSSGLTGVHDLLDRAGHHDPAERQIAGRDAFGEGQDVRRHVPVRQAEPPAGAAEPGDDLVVDQQHVMARADVAHARPVVVGRVEHAAGAVDRLADEGGNRVGPLAEDRLLQLPRRGLADALAGPRSLVSIRITRLDVNEPGHARLEHLPVRRAHPGGAHRLEREPVVAPDRGR